MTDARLNSVDTLEVVLSSVGEFLPKKKRKPKIKAK